MATNSIGTDMRVMHVITGLDTGGAETALTRLVLAKRPTDFSQYVISLTDGGRYKTDLEAAGIPVESLGMKRGRPTLGAVLRLVGLIRRYRPTVIQSWMYHADLLSLISLALSGRRRRTRIYWGVRASTMAFEKYRPTSRITFKLCAWLSAFPDGIVVNSKSGQMHHAAHGYRPRLFIRIPNGIDCQYFAPSSELRRDARARLALPADQVAAVHVARVDPMKDHATILAALERTPQIVCLAVGEGTEALPARANLIALGIKRDVRPILAAADMMVSSSIGEGFPNAVAEGMAMALPVIATDVGDVKSLVGEVGLIVGLRDPESLAKAMLELSENQERRLSMGQAARQRIVLNFSLDFMVKRFDYLHRTGHDSNQNPDS